MHGVFQDNDATHNLVAVVARTALGGTGPGMMAGGTTGRRRVGGVIERW